MTVFCKTNLHFTASEIRILRLLAEGYTHQQVAEEIHYSTGSIAPMLSRMFDRLDVSNTTQAVALAIRHHYI